MAIRRTVKTPEQVKASYARALRSDLRRFRAARAQWVTLVTQSYERQGVTATAEMVNGTSQVRDLDASIAETLAALASV